MGYADLIIEWDESLVEPLGRVEQTLKLWQH